MSITTNNSYQANIQDKYVCIPQKKRPPKGGLFFLFTELIVTIL